MEHKLDVSELEPPEPMERILEIIETLKDGDYLYVIHRREPHMIYPMLENMGIAWMTRAGGPKGYEVFIWRREDETAGAAIPA
ncbi:hypothetical protein MNBD_GAMMA26-909 [hydrothermal vent metagenome]|uniref:DUF2249 domain-containing protein n=1 Tax=hydrothermal vent metagenome TaxID=652676 RepID=A0A3B1BIP1_9ZZZZ